MCTCNGLLLIQCPTSLDVGGGGGGGDYLSQKHIATTFHHMFFITLHPLMCLSGTNSEQHMLLSIGPQKTTQKHLEAWQT